MSDDDGIEIKIRHWMPPTYSITIGDTKLVFPIGTTREEAQWVLDEALRIVREENAK